MYCQTILDVLLRCQVPFSTLGRNRNHPKVCTLVRVGCVGVRGKVNVSIGIASVSNVEEIVHFASDKIGVCINGALGKVCSASNGVEVDALKSGGTRVKVGCITRGRVHFDKVAVTVDVKLGSRRLRTGVVDLASL